MGLTHLSDGPINPERLHELVVRVALVASVGASVLLLAAWLVTGDTHYLSAAIAPAVTGGFFLGQKLTGRENALTGMVIAATVVVAAFAVVGDSHTVLGAVIALVYIGVVGAAFVPGHLPVYLFSGSLVLVATAFLWTPRLPMEISAFTTAVVMVAAFTAGATTLALFHRSEQSTSRRFQALFDLAPVGIVEQDWSRAMLHLDAHLEEGADLRTVLAGDPDLLAGTLARVRTVRANLVALEAGATGPRGTGVFGASEEGAAPSAGWIEGIAGLRERADRHRFEVETLAAGGGVVMLVVETLVLDAGLTRVVAALKDVTEERRAERALEELLRSKDQFIATVSHELRTPLTAVVGLAEALRSGSVLAEGETSELLDLIVSQSYEVAHIVEDLLVGARADLGTVTVAPQILGLHHHVMEALGSFETPIDVVSEGVDVLVLADPVRLRQIVRNLVSNAIRYGGPHRRIRLLQAEGRGVVEVRDSGTPIPEEDRDRIFEAYERAGEGSAVSASVGLGLAVSRQLARLMGGDLRYLHDGEAVFRLELPASGAAGLAGRLSA